MRTIVLLTVVFGLGVCAPASAGVAELATFKDKRTGLPVTQVRYTAVAGEMNDVSAGAVAGVWGVRDGGAAMRVGTGCAIVDEHTASCVNPTPAYYQLYIATGDLVDTVTIPPMLPNVLVDGGAGNDVLRGSPRVGLSGGAGNDLIEFDSAPLDLFCGDGDDLLGTLSPRRQVLGESDLRTCESIRLGILVIAIHPQRKGNTLTLVATCVTSGPCKGTAKFVLHRRGNRGSVSLGTARFRLTAGGDRRLRVKLNRRERRLLRERGSRVDIDVRTRNLRTGLEHQMSWRGPLHR